MTAYPAGLDSRRAGGPDPDQESPSMTSDHRARASRQNGARSRGPSTATGKARSARNALRHGLRARKLLLIDGEDAAEFRAFATRLQAELMPVGALQESLVSRITIAAWRSRRADRLEAALLGRYLAPAADADPDPQAALGAGLIRDSHGTRALETLVRYRGSALAEWFRALAALKSLQAAAGSIDGPVPPSLPPPERV
jgi:hypothetical protein